MSEVDTNDRWFEKPEVDLTDAEEEAYGGMFSNGLIWWQRKTPDDKQFPNRFRLQRGAEKHIVFLDEVGIVIWEHEFSVNGKFGGYARCVKMEGRPCPFCEAGNVPSKVRVLSIIDIEGYITKDGKEHTHLRSLYVVKSGGSKKLRIQAKRRGGLKGRKFLVARSTDQKSPRTGDDFEYVEDISDKLRPEDVPFTYADYFSTQTQEELEHIVKVSYWNGRGDGAGNNTNNYRSSGDVSYGNEPTVPF